MRSKPEPMAQVKARRDATLLALTGRVPFIQSLNIRFDRRGDELTAILPFEERFIGNPLLPALHGGATAGFLEVAASIELVWTWLWPEIEEQRLAPEDLADSEAVEMPRIVDFSVDFLRTGLPRDAYARARVNRFGRRYASVAVEGWQDNRSRLFAQATAHYVMPDR